MEGYIENVDGKPVITRIKVHYHIKVPKGKKEDAQRMVSAHEKGCPAAISVKRGIEIEYSGDIEEE